MDRLRLDGDGALHLPRRSVRPVWHRHGALLRPGRERRPLGVAVLASIFDRTGGYESAQTFNDGLVPAIWVGAAVVGAGALLALLIPRKRRPAEATVHEPESLVPQAEAA